MAHKICWNQSHGYCKGQWRVACLKFHVYAYLAKSTQFVSVLRSWTVLCYCRVLECVLHVRMSVCLCVTKCHRKQAAQCRSFRFWQTSAFWPIKGAGKMYRVNRHSTYEQLNASGTISLFQTSTLIVYFSGISSYRHFVIVSAKKNII